MGVLARLHRAYGPKAYLRRLAERRSELRVLAGPFTGMRYVDQSYGSAYLPKIVGAYERELASVVERVIGSGHDLVVDVGAAEGYYAVGFALRGEAPVIAFETSDVGRRLAETVARRNGVEARIDFRGECDCPGLERAIRGARRPFVLCDVEGYEATLLDPSLAPSLARASLLVEIHEGERPGVTALLLRRFDATHAVEFIWQEPRSHEEYPYSTFWTRRMPARYLRRAVEEERGYRQSWLWFTPREPATAAA